MGDPNTVLSRPNTVVITESTARKYFGDKNPMGKMLTFDLENFEITGVIKDPPGNTIFSFNMIRSWKSLDAGMFYPRWLNYHLTFVKLAPGANPDNFARFVTQTIRDHSKEEFKKWNVQYTSILQPLEKVHLHSENIIFERINVGNILYIYIFAGIGIIIFLITAFNYINLITARSSNRACEVGMRKVAGAQRRQLFAQFIGESLLTTMVSFALALMLVLLLLGKFNDLARLKIEYSMLMNTEFILAIIFSILVLGVAAGSYPALLLSSFKPVTVLSGSLRIGVRGSKLRRVLVIGQFALSIIMIIGVMLFSKQLNFMKKKSLGFDIEQKLIVNMQNTGVGRSNFLAVKNEFTNFPSVLGASFSTGVPGRSFRHVKLWLSGEQQTNAHDCNFFEVDGDFLELYDLKIVAGKNLSDKERTNLSYMPAILNETAVSVLGLRNPEEVINRNFMDRTPGVTAVGVVKDFHYTGLQNPIEPFAISLRGGYDYLTLKIDTRNISESLSFIEDKFQEL